MVPHWTNYNFCILESLEDSTYVQNMIQLVAFNKIDFDNRFFDSLRDDYSEFMNWVERKVKRGEKAYVLKMDGD